MVPPEASRFPEPYCEHILSESANLRAANLQTYLKLNELKNA